MNTKTAIYMRVSTEEQAKDGYGLDAQESKCRAMATVKDWPVTSVFIDDGVSGTKDEAQRPALAELLTAACSGQIDAVIVASLDRLGRNTRLVLRLIDQLAECGVEIVSCKESLDTATPTGRFVLRMFASLAELDRDNIVERTTDGRNARGLIDGERGGRVPFGYYRNGDGISINHDAARVVRVIFDLREQGKTLTAIADHLNESGITSARGRRWYASSVREILLNEADYRGGNRWQSPVKWPVILG
jgi:site-specific DNA recombinase